MPKNTKQLIEDRWNEISNKNPNLEWYVIFETMLREYCMYPIIKFESLSKFLRAATFKWNRHHAAEIYKTLDFLTPALLSSDFDDRVSNYYILNYLYSNLLKSKKPISPKGHIDSLLLLLLKKKHITLNEYRKFISIGRDESLSQSNPFPESDDLWYVDSALRNNLKMVEEISRSAQETYSPDSGAVCLSGKKLTQKIIPYVIESIDKIAGPVKQLDLSRNLLGISSGNSPAQNEHALYKKFLPLLSYIFSSSTITTLDLSHNFLKDKHADLIISKLSENNHITSIFLDGNRISKEKLDQISYLCKRNLTTLPSLKQISLFAVKEALIQGKLKLNGNDVVIMHDHLMIDSQDIEPEERKLGSDFMSRYGI